MLRILCVAPKHGGRKFSQRSNLFLCLSLTHSISLTYSLCVYESFYVSFSLSLSLCNWVLDMNFNLNLDLNLKLTLTCYLTKSNLLFCAYYSRNCTWLCSPTCLLPPGLPGMEWKKPLPDNSFAYYGCRFDFQFWFLPSVFSVLLVAFSCCVFFLLADVCHCLLSLCIKLELICNSHDLHFVQFVFWLLTWAVIEFSGRES